jgi:hypothetical protein
MYEWKSTKTDGPPAPEAGNEAFWCRSKSGDFSLFEWWPNCQMFGNSGGGIPFAHFTHYAPVPKPEPFEE